MRRRLFTSREDVSVRILETFQSYTRDPTTYIVDHDGVASIATLTTMHELKKKAQECLSSNYHRHHDTTIPLASISSLQQICQTANLAHALRSTFEARHPTTKTMILLTYDELNDTMFEEFDCLKKLSAITESELWPSGKRYTSALPMFVRKPDALLELEKINNTWSNIFCDFNLGHVVLIFRARATAVLYSTRIVSSTLDVKSIHQVFRNFKQDYDEKYNARCPLAGDSFLRAYTAQISQLLRIHEILPEDEFRQLQDFKLWTAASRMEAMRLLRPGVLAQLQPNSFSRRI